MPRLTKFMVVLRAALASALAISVAAPNQADAQSATEAQSAAAEAYRQAIEAGTIEALEQFISAYPLSPQANDAFLDIVTLSRGSSLDGDAAIPGGFFAATTAATGGGGGGAGQARGVEPAGATVPY